ncbi:MAG: hypothetical protein LIP09_14155 [Bacteroidales bacterium]|nr:hypothetical protein [Bacteroidales bacterium]MCC8119871.1 hypothetical protein [Bacteroidales bacterium]
MTLYQLNPYQLTDLKQHYLCCVKEDGYYRPSWSELANADALVSLEELESIYSDTDFSPEDFGLDCTQLISLLAETEESTNK